MKRILTMICTCMLATGLLLGCAGPNSDTWEASKEITVIVREKGSGTRGAFIELFGIEQKDADGNKVDHTYQEAQQTSSTSVVMTSVAGNKYAIGYISLGSLNDTIKPVKIDGVEATVENIKNNTYKAARPFHIAVKDDISAVAQDFINFIMSKEGQQVVQDNGYISIADGEAFTTSKPAGKITVAGSSSITPVMGKLKEAYLKLNENVELEIQESDSTTGMNSVVDGVCDIGMASRELKDSETAKGITGIKIAMDGIVVIVNKENTTDNITAQKVGEIFMGQATKWSEVGLEKLVGQVRGKPSGLPPLLGFIHSVCT